MKKLVYSFGISIIISIIMFACEKEQEDLSQHPLNEPLNPTETTIEICHLENGNWTVITIDQDDWPAHEAHGDMYWQEFPQEAVYKWVFLLNGIESLNSMYITEISGSNFIGYGIDHEGDRDWDIVDGTIYEDGSISFTVDYVDSGDYLDCIGSFECGLGITGTADGTETGTWSGFYNGGFSDEWEAIDIGP